MEEDNGGESSYPARTHLETLTKYKLDKSVKATNWKEKLRESCCRRVREDRSRLLWNMRSSAERQTTNEKEMVKSALLDIVTDELRKIKGTPSGEAEVKGSNLGTDDMLWEYDGFHTAYQGECEAVLLEMQRIFYEDSKIENQAEVSLETWIDEEDEYLARAVDEYMQLNEEKANQEQTWCPICKKGELKESSNLIYCIICQFQLQRGNEVNLALLRTRLAEAYDEHLNRGCRSKPEFCVVTIFDLTALYIECQRCGTFEVVV